MIHLFSIKNVLQLLFSSKANLQTIFQGVPEHISFFHYLGGFSKYRMQLSLKAIACV